MSLRPFSHRSAKSLEEAALASRTGKTAVIAGGTDLLGALKDGIHPETPELLVDLKTIPGLRHIEADGKGLRVGALATLAEVAAHKTIRERYPLLAEAARAVASPQIRNMGTVGGNLCQEPRCWYYRTPENLFHCLRKGGDKCGAFFGENRYHSVFGSVRVGAPPCAAGCPNLSDIPAVMSSVRQGDMKRAAETLLDANPMPAVTGRVCPHTCEEGCSRNEFDEPVSVREVERFVGDHILEHSSEFYKAPRTQTRKRVAVVGAGPAGLAAAYHLRKIGHKVTVLDRMPEPGGMLAYAVPSYRLPKDVVRQQIQALERMGIAFQSDVEVGIKGRTLKDLRKQYDAVFLATGTWRQKTLGMAGEDALGSGLQFLIDIQRGMAPSVGRKTLVIGGGSVAVDVAISALRLGSREVSMACLESRGEMPALPEDIEQALAEKIAILPSWGPHRVIEQGGVLKGMEFVRCTSVFDEQKRFRPVFDPKVTKTVEADQVLLAIGQSPDLAYTGRDLKTERGLIAVDPETLATNLPGVFAGGDAASGPATVVKALAAGRKAAGAIDAYLGGGKKRVGHSDEDVSRALQAFGDCSLQKTGRVRTPGPLQRNIGQEDRPTLGLEAITGEAHRCANCGCVAVNASDLAPALVALGAVMKTTKRSIPAEEFFAVRERRTTVLEPSELLKEVFIPRPGSHSRQSFLKFRIRNAIDFPIVSVASVLELAGGRVKNVKIALGAVAPVPLKAREVEDYLKGKKLDAITAEEAGAVAVKGTLPLGKNAFKIQLVRALLKKALSTGIVR